MNSVVTLFMRIQALPFIMHTVVYALVCFRNPFLDYAKIKITIKPRKQKIVGASA